MSNNALHTISLFDWARFDGVKFNRSDEEFRELFLVLDKSMRYLHKQGFYITSFDPRDIDLVDGDINSIRFNKFESIDNNFDTNTITCSDINICASLQIGFYTQTLLVLDENKLKEKFDEFANSIPDEDVPYYRGVIQRNANVYLCDFVLEKRNRDLKNLQKELASENKDISLEEPAPVNEDVLINKKRNDDIYKDLIAKKKIKVFSDKAYVYALVLPTIILSLGVIVILISFILNLFG